MNVLNHLTTSNAPDRGNKKMAFRKMPLRVGIKNGLVPSYKTLIVLMVMVLSGPINLSL
jgi:hypothetical protein